MSWKIIIGCLIGIGLFFWGCTPSLKKRMEFQKKSGKKIIEKAIEAHGGSKYDYAHYEFVFRDKTYTFQNQKSQYKYTQKGVDKAGKNYFHVLDNGNFTRSVDGNEEDLTEKDIRRYSNSLNSVLYFATLPSKLKDPAVNYLSIGQTKILNKDYHIVQITFDQEGDGEDFDDEYYYWINKENFRIDYLAYNFHVNGGGVRFRSAFNTRNVDGILFQDYINYKAPKETPLKALPKMFEKKILEKLSEIKTEQVKNLGK